MGTKRHKKVIRTVELEEEPPKPEAGVFEKKKANPKRCRLCGAWVDTTVTECMYCGNIMG